MIKYLQILRNIKEMISLIQWLNIKSLNLEKRVNNAKKEIINQKEEDIEDVVVGEATILSIGTKGIIIIKESLRRVTRQNNKDVKNKIMKETIDENTKYYPIIIKNTYQILNITTLLVNI